MCCQVVCLQGLHSTRHLQYSTQELAIRVATVTQLAKTKEQKSSEFPIVLGKIQIDLKLCFYIMYFFL